MLTRAPADHIPASGGRGSGSGGTGGAPGHLPLPPGGTLLYTVLPKSVKNGPKRGYPLYLTGSELAPPT